MLGLRTQIIAYRFDFMAVALFQWLHHGVGHRTWIAIFQMSKFTLDILNCCRYVLTKQGCNSRRISQTISVTFQVLSNALSSQFMFIFIALKFLPCAPQPTTLGIYEVIIMMVAGICKNVYTSIHSTRLNTYLIPWHMIVKILLFETYFLHHNYNSCQKSSTCF